MLLLDIVGQLAALAPDETIYATRPWSPGSNAILARDPDSGILSDAIADLGMSYFLEVFIAQELVADWGSAALSDVSAVCNRLIRYATDDA